MLTSAQLDLQSSARRALRARPDWAQFAELGWLGVAIDEAQGGFGGPAEMVLLAQELAVAASSEPFLTAAVVPSIFLANAPLNPATEGLLESVIAGKKRVVAAFDVPGPHCTYPVRFSGTRLIGRCSHVLGGAGAQSILLAAQQVDHPSVRAVFLLDSTSKGVKLSSAPTIDGRESAFFEIDAEAVEWPNRGDAMAAFELAQDAGLLGQVAEIFGLTQNLFDMTQGYLLERRQFGQPLAEFQVLRHRLADMYAELEQSRAMLDLGIQAMRSPRRSRVLSACKVRIARAARFVGAQAIQLHGAIALTQEYAVARAYQRLLVSEKTWGDPEFHIRRFNAAMGDVND